MSLCIQVSEWGDLQVLSTSIEECTSYVLVSASSYNQSNEPIVFNGDLFLYISGVLLVNLIVGHSTGRIVRMLSKR